MCPPAVAVAGAAVGKAALGATAASSIFTLGNIGTAVSLAGGLFSAYSNYQQSKAQAKALSAQADAQEQQALDQKRRAVLEEQQFRENATVRASEGEAILIAAGHDPSTSRVLDDYKRAIEFDALQIRRMARPKPRRQLGRGLHPRRGAGDEFERHHQRLLAAPSDRIARRRSLV